MDSDCDRYGLAIHTASPDLGLAIAGQMAHLVGDRRQQVWSLGRDLSTHLHVHLAEFLQPQTWADLDFIAVARGPGGFTGTRLGVVTARTLAQQLAIPLFPISTLAAFAWVEDSAKAMTEPPEPPDTAIAIQMRAQRGEVFGAIYQWIEGDLVPQVPDAIFSEADWQKLLAGQSKPYRLIEAEGGLGTSVTGVLALAQQGWARSDRPNWSAALPFYGQHPVQLAG